MPVREEPHLREWRPFGVPAHATLAAPAARARGDCALTPAGRARILCGGMLRRVLAIDDSTVALEMYRLILSQYRGCEIVMARNGAEALGTLSRPEPIDLILLDINMPVMNGLEFLRRIRQEPAQKDIPVIIISTEGREEDTLQGLKMGAQAYIKKPFKETELRALIRKIVPPE